MLTTPATAVLRDPSVLERHAPMAPAKLHRHSQRSPTRKDDDSSDGPPMRHIQKPPRRINDSVRSADLRLLGRDMRLPQPADSLLGRLAGDPGRGLRRRGRGTAGALGRGVRNRGREARGVLDAPRAHSGRHAGQQRGAIADVVREEPATWERIGRGKSPRQREMGWMGWLLAPLRFFGAKGGLLNGGIQWA